MLDRYLTLQSGESMRDCFFTSISSNYIDKALALAESIFSIYPNSNFVISLLNYRHLSDSSKALLQSLIDDYRCKGHALSFFDPLRLYEEPSLFIYKFSVVEACTAVKPAVALALLELHHCVTYMDPDTILYSRLPPDPIQGNQWNVQVTPHSIAPTPRKGLVSERLFMYFGVFNLGYFSVQRGSDTTEFLAWWKQFCVDYGADAPAGGLFVDQKPVDLLPCFTDRVSVLRHAGCNVAWWNLFSDNRRVDDAGQHILFRNTQVPLVFFHFSNLDTSRDGRDRLVARPLASYIAAPHEGAHIADETGLVKLFGDYAEKVASFAHVKRAMSGKATSDTPLMTRVLFCEALRRGMRQATDPSLESHRQVAWKSMRYLMSHASLRDLKSMVTAWRHMYRVLLSPSLLQHVSR